MPGRTAGRRPADGLHDASELGELLPGNPASPWRAVTNRPSLRSWLRPERTRDISGAVVMPEIVEFHVPGVHTAVRIERKVGVLKGRRLANRSVIAKRAHAGRQRRIVGGNDTAFPHRERLHRVE